MSDPVKAIAVSLEVALLFGGVVLFWWLVLRPAVRRAAPPPALLISPISKHAFMMFVLYVLAGMFAFGVVGSLLARAFALTGTAHTMLASAGSQLGWILAVVAHWFEYESKETPPAAVPRESFFSARVVLSGVATFLIALPLLVATSFLWRTLLKLMGITPRPQDLVGMFARAESPLLLALMIILAVVLAPVAEELVFRRGLFRHLRTRVPRIVALLAPAIVFSALHMHFTGLAPLAMLAVVFSLAYERTGHIGTPIIAHALFNLNTIALILAGATDIT